MAKEIISNTTVNPIKDTVVFLGLKDSIKKASNTNLSKDRDYDLFDQKSAVNKSVSEDVTGETDTVIESNPVSVAQTVLKAFYALNFYNHCIYQ